MTLPYIIKKSIFIVPARIQPGVKERQVTVIIEREGEDNEQFSFCIPASARCYQLTADYGETVTTYVRNVSRLSNGARVFSKKSASCSFSAPICGSDINSGDPSVEAPAAVICNREPLVIRGGCCPVDCQGNEVSTSGGSCQQEEPDPCIPG